MGFVLDVILSFTPIQQVSTQCSLDARGTWAPTCSELVHSPGPEGWEPCASGPEWSHTGLAEGCVLVLPAALWGTVL